MPSWKKPTPEQVAKAVSLLSRAGQLRYFFDRLENPLWLESLDAGGFFKEAPEPVESDDGNWVRFPSWPAGRYLARVAVHQPDLAVQIANRIQSQNQSVHQDLLDTALAVPASHSVSLLPKFLDWAKQPRMHPFLADKLGEVAAHLARGGETASALALAEEVLRPRSRHTDYSGVQAEAPVNNWHYKESLSLLLEPLTTCAEEDAVRLFCRLLDAAISLEKLKAGAVTSSFGKEDYSNIRRPAVEDHPENEPEGLLDALTSAVRDSALQILNHDPHRLSDLLAILAEWDWKIFHRISLHLIRLSPDVPSGVLADALVNPEKLDDPTIHHEYFLLLQEKFNELPSSGRNTILDSIEEGPDLEHFLAWQRETRGEEPTPAEQEEVADSWRYKRLIPIAGYLEGSWQQRFNRYREQFGEPEYPELSSRGVTTGWIGEDSPKSAEELLALDVREIVSFLREWPLTEGGIRGPVGGLARALSEAVSREPARFASHAEGFRRLEPPYVEAFFDGLRTSLKDNPALEWQQALDLGQWLLAQPNNEPANENAFRWKEARKSLVRLLDQALRPGDAEIPAEFQPQTAELLATLAEDYDPAPGDEEEYGENLDPATVSLNTVRPLALSALVRLGLRIRSDLEDQRGMLRRGFENIPGIQPVLDRHLDPIIDPAPSVRSVYGRWLPWLQLLDARWTSEAIPRIFPLGDANRRLYEAAWVTYIVFCRPFNGMLELLRKQYRSAVDQIGSWTEKATRPANPDERVSEHLVSFYWRGELELDDDDQLLRRFFAKAPDELRQHAIEFVGRSLRNTEDEVDTEILERLQTLWDDRVAAAEASGAVEAFSAEKGAFVWWFLSGKLDPSWVLPRLLAVLEQGGALGFSAHLLTEELAKIAEDHPLESIRILALAAYKDDSAYLGSSSRSAFKTVIAAASKSSDAAAQRAAQELLEELGRRGDLQFRDLARELR